MTQLKASWAVTKTAADPACACLSRHKENSGSEQKYSPLNVENKPCTNGAIDLLPMELSRDAKLKASGCPNCQFAQSFVEQAYFS
jgi:hypothetical protein